MRHRPPNDAQFLYQDFYYKVGHLNFVYKYILNSWHKVNFTEIKASKTKKKITKDQARERFIKQLQKHRLELLNYART